MNFLFVLFIVATSVGTLPLLEGSSVIIIGDFSSTPSGWEQTGITYYLKQTSKAIVKNMMSKQMLTAFT